MAAVEEALLRRSGEYFARTTIRLRELNKCNDKKDAASEKNTMKQIRNLCGESSSQLTSFRTMLTFNSRGC
uniref:Uncharacterized protein n=1 Tax=Caenorhabditis japonica TaxID=281687 RepID=A0A8R1EGJ8_CAEJA